MKEGWCPEGISEIKTIADTAEEQLLTKMRKAGSTLKGQSTLREPGPKLSLTSL